MSRAKPVRIKTASPWGTRRFTLGEAALQVEERDPVFGVWRAAPAIPYEAVRAVYTYRSEDWQYLTVALLYGLLGGLALLIGGLAASAAPATWALTFVLLGLSVTLLALYRIFVVQRSWVRLDLGGFQTDFATRETAFVEQLLARLPIVYNGPPEAAAPPSPAAPPVAEIAVSPFAPAPPVVPPAAPPAPAASIVEAPVAAAAAPPEMVVQPEPPPPPAPAEGDASRWAWRGGETAAEEDPPPRE